MSNSSGQRGLAPGGDHRPGHPGCPEMYRLYPEENGGFLWSPALTLTPSILRPSGVVPGSDEGEFVTVVNLPGQQRHGGRRASDREQDLHPWFPTTTCSRAVATASVGCLSIGCCSRDSVMIDNAVLINYIVELRSGGKDAYADPMGDGLHHRSRGQ